MHTTPGHKHTVSFQANNHYGSSAVKELEAIRIELFANANESHNSQLKKQQHITM